MRDKIMPRVARLKLYAPYFLRDGRLRSGWRVALYIAASFIALFVFGLVFVSTLTALWISRGISFEGVQLLLADFSTRPFNYPDVAVPYIIGRVLVPLGIIWIFRRWIDRRPFLDLGFQMSPGWQRELGAGFALSVAVWVVIFLLALVLGAVSVTDFSWNLRGILPMLGLLALGLFFNLLVGIAEESDARGYILQNLEEGIGFRRAAIISSLYFAVVHLLNPGAGIGSAIGIFAAGILLAVGYYITRRLWFAIGMHAAWNFAEGSLFGFRVSGLNLDGLLELKIIGADWLIGGAFGPEAGVLAIVVEIAMIGLLLGWHKDRLASAKQYLGNLYANVASSVKRTLDQASSATRTSPADQSPSVENTQSNGQAPSVTRALSTDSSPSEKLVPSTDQVPSATCESSTDQSPSAKLVPTIDQASSTKHTPSSDQATAIKPTRLANQTPDADRSPAANPPTPSPQESAGVIDSIRSIGAGVKEFFEVFFAGWGEPPFRR